MGAVTGVTAATGAASTAAATVTAILAKLGPVVSLVASVAGLGWAGVIAAAVLLLAGVGAFFYLNGKANAVALAQTQADQVAAQASTVQASQSVEQPQQAGHDTVTALEGDPGTSLPKR